MRAPSRYARLAAVVLALAILTPPSDSATAQTTFSPTTPTSSFDAVVAAYGFDSTLSNPSIPIGLVIEGAGPTAQAHLSSLQASDGFASFPYPGDTVVGLPGLVSAVFLGGAPVPAYPFYVSTAYGQQPAAANYPGVALSSESNGNEARANAVVGTSATGYTSNAVISQASDSTVTATATATLSGVQVGTGLLLSGVVSTATEVLEFDGTLKGTSSLSIARLTVPGLHFTIPKTTPTSAAIPIPFPGVPQLPPLSFPPVPVPFGGTTLNAPDIGFVDGQFTLTLPIGGGETFAVPAQAVLDAFKAAGFDISYQAAQKTANSVVAPELIVHTVLPAPPKNSGFNGSTPVTVTVGRSTASISAASVGTSGGGASSGLPSRPTGVEAPSVSSAPTTAGSVTPQENATAPTPPAAPALSGGQARPVASPLVGVTARTRFSSIFDIYLVLVGVGLIGTLAAQVLRHLGVRTSWRS